MDNQNTQLSEEDMAQREKFINERSNSQNKPLIVSLTIIITFFVIVGVLISNHNKSVALEKENKIQAQIAAQKQHEINQQKQMEEDFKNAYAGRLEAWENILGNSNPIQGWPVRHRSVILDDISLKESQILRIQGQIRAATTQTQYEYSNSYGDRGSASSSSYNAETMTRLTQELKYAEYDLYLLEVELQRDDYFQGKIAGYNLRNAYR